MNGFNRILVASALTASAGAATLHETAYAHFATATSNCSDGTELDSRPEVVVSYHSMSDQVGKTVLTLVGDQVYDTHVVTSDNPDFSVGIQAGEGPISVSSEWPGGKPSFYFVINKCEEEKPCPSEVPTTTSTTTTTTTEVPTTTSITTTTTEAPATTKAPTTSTTEAATTSSSEASTTSSAPTTTPETSAPTTTAVAETTSTSATPTTEGDGGIITVPSDSSMPVITFPPEKTLPNTLPELPDMSTTTIELTTDSTLPHTGAETDGIVRGASISLFVGAVMAVAGKLARRRRAS